MSCCSREASQHRYDSPTDQYPRNPDASAEPVQQQIAWYLENEVAPKEYARQQPELLARDSQLFIHCQRCEPDVDTVNKVNDEQNEDGWDDVRFQLQIVVASTVVGAGDGLAVTPHPRDGSAQCSTESRSRIVSRTVYLFSRRCRAVPQ